MISKLVSGACLAIGLAGSASASPCADQIASFSKRVEEQSRAAVAASTSGKAEAAAREGQGTVGSAGGSAAEKPPLSTLMAGEGADKAQAAKVALDEAQTADGKGDEKGCSDAIARAKQNLETSP